MDDNNYTFPKDFDPYLAVYALKGLAELQYKYYTEGGGIYNAVPAGDHENLLGLSWLNRRIANELSGYFAALDDAGIKMPVSQEGLSPPGGVEEERGLYAVGAA